MNPKSKGLGRGLSALLPDADLPSDNQLLVPIADIRPNHLQPRRDFKPDELSDLAASIKEKGVIQPLVVHRVDDQFELVAGERRLRASQIAGLKEVPVRVIEVKDDQELLELSIIENLQREDLNPVELAEGYRVLNKKMGITQEEIAVKVGKDRATISNLLRLLDLPPNVLEGLRKGSITTGHAKAILSVTGAAQQSALFKRVVSDALSVRQTETIAGGMKVTKDILRKTAPTASDGFRRETDRLRQRLGTKVQISHKGKEGVIKIGFYSQDDLDRLLELLLGHEVQW